MGEVLASRDGDLLSRAREHALRASALLTVAGSLERSACADDLRDAAAHAAVAQALVAVYRAGPSIELLPQGPGSPPIPSDWPCQCEHPHSWHAPAATAGAAVCSAHGCPCAEYQEAF